MGLPETQLNTPHATAEIVEPRRNSPGVLGKVPQMATVGIKLGVEFVERLRPVVVLTAILIHGQSIAPNVTN